LGGLLSDGHIASLNTWMDDNLGAEQILTSSPSVKQMIYIAVLCNPKITTEPLYNIPLFFGPYAAANNTALLA